MRVGLRTTALFTAVIGLLLSITAFSPAVHAQTSTETSCTTVDFNGFKLIVGRNSRTMALPVSLPAGEITIPSARASDGYDTRIDVFQSSEKYEIEFLGADGSVVATSEATGDVPDNLVYAEWIGSLGSTFLPAPVVAVRAHHRPDLPSDGSPQSVLADEVTFCFETEIADPPPTCDDPGVTTNPDGTPCETPTTTVPGDTTTTTDGEEVAGPTVSTTAVPTTAPTTAAPTTAPTTAAPTTAAPTTAGEEVAGPTTSLPATGSNTGLVLVLGGVIVAAGAAFVATQRRAAA